MSILTDPTPAIVAVCPRCSHLAGRREIPTVIRDTAMFICSSCGFMWCKRAKELSEPAVRKP